MYMHCMAKDTYPKLQDMSVAANSLFVTQLRSHLENKKLCYCRGTVKHAMLVNLCYVSQSMGVMGERFPTAKLTFKVIQGYWQQCQSIGHILLLISLHCNYAFVLHR